MSALRRRQVHRLEMLAQPHLERKRQIEEHGRLTLEGAAAHAAAVAFIVRYGEPKLTEPLSLACERVSQSKYWHECCDRFPHLLNRRGFYKFAPYSRLAVSVMGHAVRHGVIDHFHGNDEREKLNLIFASAPAWLMWFTFADYTAKLLNLAVPDMSMMISIARTKTHFDLWWGLPRDVLENRPWPNGPENEPLAQTDLGLLRPSPPLRAQELSPRQLRREQATREHVVENPWPALIPEDFLKLPIDEMKAIESHQTIDFRHEIVRDPRRMFD